MWFLYALVSALIASARRASEKQLSHQLNHFTIGWTMQLCALPILAIALLCAGTLFNPFDLGRDFWIPTVLIWFGFYPINTYLYINSFKHGDLSKILPLSSLGPIFALLLGWATLGEQPSLSATISILITVFGIYILNIQDQYLHNPLKIFTTNKANLYALFGMVTVTFAGILDKMAIDASEPIYYSFVSTLGAVLSIFISAKITKVKEYSGIGKRWKSLALTGALFGASYCAYILALASGPLAYVTALRSGSALLAGSIIGIVMLKEDVTRAKILGLILIVCGSAALAIS